MPTRKIDPASVATSVPKKAVHETEDPQKRVAYRVRELPISGPDMRSHFLRTYSALPFVVGTVQFSWPEHLKPKARKPKAKKSQDGSQ